MKLVHLGVEGNELVILELTKSTTTKNEYIEIGRIKFIPTKKVKT